MPLSHNEINQLLSKAINKGRNAYDVGGSWVRDVFDTYFVYSDTKEKLWTRPYSIGDDREVTLGEATEVEQTTAYTPVARGAAFTLSGSVTFSDDFVEREGIIFEAGDYPEQDFSMTPDELKNSVEKFEPVDLELEHYDSKGMPNLLTGRLGKVVSAYASEDGKELRGRVRIPRWLHTEVGEEPIKVSSVFDRTNKLLTRVGLVLRPQVARAAVFSYATFAGARHSTSDMADLQSIHDLVVKQGAVCQSDAQMSRQPNPTPNGEKKMTLKERWDNFIKGKTPEQLQAVTPEELAVFAQQDPPPADPPTTTPPTTPAPDPKIAEMQAQLDNQNRQIAQFAARERLSQATAAVDALVREGKMYPSERAAAIAAFSQAAEDDEATKTLVTFSEGGVEKKATRVQVLEAGYKARPAHNLTSEQVAAFALPNGGTDKTAEHTKEVDRVLALTAEGKAALAARNNGNKN